MFISVRSWFVRPDRIIHKIFNVKDLDTFRFPDYSKVVMELMDLIHKEKRRRDVF